MPTYMRDRSASRAARQSVRTSQATCVSAPAVQSQYGKAVTHAYAPLRTLVRSASLKCVRAREAEARFFGNAGSIACVDSVDCASKPACKPGYQSNISKTAYTPPTVDSVSRRVAPFESYAPSPWSISHYARRFDSPWSRPPRIALMDDYQGWHRGHIHSAWYPSAYAKQSALRHFGAFRPPVVLHQHISAEEDCC